MLMYLYGQFILFSLSLHPSLALLFSSETSSQYWWFSCYFSAISVYASVCVFFLLFVRSIICFNICAFVFFPSSLLLRISRFGCCCWWFFFMRSYRQVDTCCRILARLLPFCINYSQPERKTEYIDSKYYTLVFGEKNTERRWNEGLDGEWLCKVKEKKNKRICGHTERFFGR